MKLSDVPDFTHPEATTFLWAIGFGVGAALLGCSIRRLALLMRPHIERRPLILTPAAGVVVAGLAVIYAEASRRRHPLLRRGESADPRTQRRDLHGWCAPTLDRLQERGLRHFA